MKALGLACVRGLCVVLFSAAAAWPRTAAAPDDPYLWLEPLSSPRALAWVKAQNKQTLDVLAADTHYASFHKEITRLLKDKDRLPMPELQGQWVYNFWQDGRHMRGLWRRVLLSDYSKHNPPWQTILDVDALAKKEHEDWVWSEDGANCLPPDYDRCLVSLSRGGKDAAVIREFDVPSRSFVKNGFETSEAKSEVAWMDHDHLLIGTNFGPGSLTSSGYPRLVKIWTRGTPLSQARLVFSGKADDVDDSGGTYFGPSGSVSIVTQFETFFNSRKYLLKLDGTLETIPLPEDAQLEGIFRGQIIALLRSPWPLGGGVFPQGSLVSLPMEGIGSGSPMFALVHMVYHPDQSSAFVDVSEARDGIYLDTLHNVSGQVLALDFDGEKWKATPVALPGNGDASVVASDPFEDAVIIKYESFLVPPTLYEVDKMNPRLGPQVIRRQRARFDASNLTVEQLWTKSADGVMIPYFLVHTKDMKHDGNNPTILYGYGGFEASMLPSYSPYYSPVIGNEWLAKGMVFAMANIRGGGEFGPRWHEAALTIHRQKAYDDFLAVAQDLIQTKVTSPERLGIMGRSNGGLLVGAAFTERPDLFHAVICEVPLLDMMRYTQIGAGASWTAEYGDPADPAMAQVLLRYSPYQNVKPGVRYPRVFFVTSSDDDRVEPAHARKMAAKMEAMGDPVFFYESSEGGHGRSATTSDQMAKTLALQYDYLERQLVDDQNAPATRH